MEEKVHSGDGSAAQANELRNFSPYVELQDTKHTLFRYVDEQTGAWMPRYLGNNVPLLGYANPMGALYSDSCFGRVPPGFLIGLGGGAAFAFIMETFSNNSVNNYTLGAPMPPGKPLKEEFGAMARSYARSTVRMSKQFAPMSAVFVYSECMCERIRGKHDMWNPIIGGCAAGAALSAPTKSATAMAGGCAMFAAFSAAMEVFMGTHS